MVSLPNVQVIRRGRKTYYYHVPNRNTSYQGQRISLGTDVTDPEFWRRYNEARGDVADAGTKSGTFSALIQEYKNSHYWKKLSHNTQVDYSIYLKRIEEIWGNLQVSGLTTVGIYKLRDRYAATPAGANHLVSILKILLTYAIERDYSTINPALSVRALKVTEQNATPWSEAAYQIFMRQAPEYLRRAVFLGRATGQRASDLVRMSKQHRRDDGLDVTIRKLRYKRHFVILKDDELAEIDSWSCAEVGPWILSPDGRAMSVEALQSGFDRFRDTVPELAMGNILREPVKLHGLRAMAVCDRRMDDMKHEDIANQLCMSLEMVIRYSKRIDSEALARKAKREREQKAHRLKKTGG
jgi:hypothetical protein